MNDELKQMLHDYIVECYAGMFCKDFPFEMIDIYHQDKHWEVIYKNECCHTGKDSLNIYYEDLLPWMYSKILNKGVCHD